MTQELFFPFLDRVSSYFHHINHTGAPESILDRCSSIMLPDGTLEPLTETSKKLILGKMLDMAGGAGA